MDDDDVRDALRESAPVSPPDRDDFEAILRRAQRGRTRWLGVALVVALVAGPAAGLLVGRSLEDGRKPVSVASGNGEDSRAGALPQPLLPPTPDAVVGFSPGFGSPFEALKPLFVRETTDGIAIRVYEAAVSSARAAETRTPGGTSVACDKDGACAEPAPPISAECHPSAMLQAELSNAAAVAPGSVAAFEAAADRPLAMLHAAYFGVEEGSPASWVAVHVNDAAKTVRAHFADGSVDEMTPVAGYAVLAHQTAAPPQPVAPDNPEEFHKSMVPAGSVEALDESGAVLSTASFSDTGFPGPACVPAAPAPLPAPVPPPTTAG